MKQISEPGYKEVTGLGAVIKEHAQVREGEEPFLGRSVRDDRCLRWG